MICIIIHVFYYVPVVSSRVCWSLLEFPRTEYADIPIHVDDKLGHSMWCVLLETNKNSGVYLSSATILIWWSAFSYSTLCTLVARNLKLLLNLLKELKQTSVVMEALWICHGKITAIILLLEIRENYLGMGWSSGQEMNIIWENWLKKSEKLILKCWLWESLLTLATDVYAFFHNNLLSFAWSYLMT